MKLNDAYDLLIDEYLSKCKEYGCDSCIAQAYCIEHQLRHSRYPDIYCHDNLKLYLRSKKRS